MAFFTPGEVENESTKNLIPAGNYLAEIHEVDEIEKQWGRGCIIRYKILYPIAQHGMKIQECLCMEHSKPEVQRIAHQQMEMICKAIERKEPIERSYELVGSLLKIDVVHKPHSKNAGEVQENVKYRSKLLPADKALVPEIDNLVKKKYRKEQEEFNARKKASSQLIDDNDIPF